MALIEWNDEYSVGVPQFDEDHKQLFGLINELDAAVNENATAETVLELVEKLVDATKRHFDAEEQSMQLSDFAGLAEHRARHQDLLFEVDMLVDKIRSGERTVSRRLVEYLRDHWVLSHILGMDTMYGPFLSEET